MAQASRGCLLHLVAVFMTLLNLWDGEYCALSPMGSSAGKHRTSSSDSWENSFSTIIKTGIIFRGRGKILSYSPPHSCLIVTDKSGNGECDIVKYFHSISVKYFPPQAENIFNAQWDRELGRSVHKVVEQITVMPCGLLWGQFFSRI